MTTHRQVQPKHTTKRAKWAQQRAAEEMSGKLQTFNRSRSCNCNQETWWASYWVHSRNRASTWINFSSSFQNGTLLATKERNGQKVTRSCRWSAAKEHNSEKSTTLSARSTQTFIDVWNQDCARESFFPTQLDVPFSHFFFIFSIYCRFHLWLGLPHTRKNNALTALTLLSGFFRFFWHRHAHKIARIHWNKCTLCFQLRRERDDRQRGRNVGDIVSGGRFSEFIVLKFLSECVLSVCERRKLLMSFYDSMYPELLFQFPRTNCLCRSQGNTFRFFQ